MGRVDSVSCNVLDNDLSGLVHQVRNDVQLYDCVHLGAEVIKLGDFVLVSARKQSKLFLIKRILYAHHELLLEGILCSTVPADSVVVNAKIDIGNNCVDFYSYKRGDRDDFYAGGSVKPQKMCLIDSGKGEVSVTPFTVSGRYYFYPHLQWGQVCFY